MAVDLDEALSILKTTTLFSNLDTPTIVRLARKLGSVHLSDGDRLFTAGEEGRTMYVVAHGTMVVHDGTTVLNTLSAGDAFGEYALLESVVRTASVTATSDCRLLSIEKDLFLRLIDESPQLTRHIIAGLIKRVTTEKDRAEKLLQSILPRNIAEEYKANGFVKARRHEHVTVLFTDFSGFTRASARMSPVQVVEELDCCFSAFDEIADKYDLQKIKTTGDGYMCAGGIPFPNDSNPLDVVLAALEIQRFMDDLLSVRTANGVDYWRCRIGIETGSCIAAVIGKSKLTYDLWSDTVNLASHMETWGQAGRVNIGPGTQGFISEFFDCEDRGEIVTKVGPINMFFVNGIRAALSIDARGVERNERFNALRAERFGTGCPTAAKLSVGPLTRTARGQGGTFLIP